MDEENYCLTTVFTDKTRDIFAKTRQAGGKRQNNRVAIAITSKVKEKGALFPKPIIKPT